MRGSSLFKVVLVAFLPVVALTVGARILTNRARFAAALSSPERMRAGLSTAEIARPDGANDFAFVSNHEQVAYISQEVPSMIHFQPGDAENLPQELRLALPSGVEVLGAVRNLEVYHDRSAVEEIQGTDGQTTQFTNIVRIKTLENASKFILIWKANQGADWPEGKRFLAYFWGYSKAGAQAYQPLVIEVVKVPEAKPFKTLPVWLSLPSDLIYKWPDTPEASTDAFRQIGISSIELWAYVRGRVLPGSSRSDREAFGHDWLKTSAAKLKASGIETVPTGSDWWWRSAQQTEVGRATTLEGEPAAELRLTYNDDADGTGGEYFRDWLEQGKYLIDNGFYFHGLDPEMYREGDLIDYSPATLAAFETYYQNQTSDRYIEPERLAKNPGKWPEAERIWNQFKAHRYSQFFVDYRAEMEGYMDRRGFDRSQTPFQLRALTTYHRTNRGFVGYLDYTQSPVYTQMLEDPQRMAEVFDYLAPMIYVDIYGEGDFYDMKLPQEDTAVLRRLTADSPRGTKISPILSAGYPFMADLESDVSAAMLKANILETLAAGGYGFGIWGESPIDALDMKAIAQTVGMLSPYEDILLEGTPTDGVRVYSNRAFASRIAKENEEETQSLVLISEYSEQPKAVTVELAGRKNDVVIDLASGEEVPRLLSADSLVKFQTALNDEKGRARMFYVGPPV